MSNKPIQDTESNLGQEPLEGGLVYQDILTTPAVQYGLYPGGYNRMSPKVRNKISEGISYLNTNTSGGRFRFRTDSSGLGVRVTFHQKAAKYALPHMPLTGVCGTDVFLGEVGQNTCRPEYDMITAQEEYVISPQDSSEVTLYLPLYSSVKSIEIGLEADASLFAPIPFDREHRIIFYGSSITQGGCASKPANSYPALLGRWIGCDFANFGYSGNAKGEQVMAEYLASQDMDCLVYDYDHNASDYDHLKSTHRSFLETILKHKPQLKVLFVSKPNPQKNTEDFQRRELIRKNYEWALSKGYRVDFVDGDTLWNPYPKDCCSVDDVHPNDLGFYSMGKVMYPKVKQLLEY